MHVGHRIANAADFGLAVETELHTFDLKIALMKRHGGWAQWPIR